MKIAFDRPFSFRLDVVDIEKHLPSMKVDVQLDLLAMGYSLYYKASFWILGDDWKSFIYSLRSSTDDHALLKEHDRNFCIKITKRKSTNPIIYWSINKKDTLLGDMNINFSSEIDDDMFGKIKDEFFDFPKFC